METMETNLESEKMRVLEALSYSLLHTSAVATAAGLDQMRTGMILARLYREGKVERYFPRKTNMKNEKLWSRKRPE